MVAYNRPRVSHRLVLQNNLPWQVHRAVLACGLLLMWGKDCVHIVLDSVVPGIMSSLQSSWILGCTSWAWSIVWFGFLPPKIAPGLILTCVVTQACLVNALGPPGLGVAGGLTKLCRAVISGLLLASAGPVPRYSHFCFSCHFVCVAWALPML